MNCPPFFAVHRPTKPAFHWCRFATALILLAMLGINLGGCSSTGQRQTEALATQGRDYADTLKRVNSMALDRSLEFTADLLPNLPRTQATLDNQTQDMRVRKALLAKADAHLDALARYFESLEALASGDELDNTDKAASALLDSIKAVPGGLSLAEGEKKAVTGLAKVVTKLGYRQAVVRTLERDADVVAQALLLSERMLDEQIRWIEPREKLGREVDYRDKVQKPFLSDKALPDGWKKAWVADIKTSSTLVVLVEAKDASQTMQKAWMDLLRGQNSFGSVGASLRRVQGQLRTVLR